jgi:hypothetical protein
MILYSFFFTSSLFLSLVLTQEYGDCAKPAITFYLIANTDGLLEPYIVVIYFVEIHYKHLQILYDAYNWLDF